MNFENMNLLSQKVESVLGTVRALREENAKLKQLLEGKDAQAEDQKNLLDSANAKIADYEAALNARANQAAAQDEATTKPPSMQEPTRLPHRTKPSTKRMALSTT